MSKHHIEKITCPSCNKESSFKVWDSLNTVIDPDMKASVMNGDIFRFRCPFCNTEAFVNYDFLYHDMENHIMIYLIHGGEKAVNQAKEMLLGESGVLARFGLDGAMDGYKYRIVTSFNSLLEKIFIFGSEYDDRVVEIVKLMLFYRAVSTENLAVNDALFAKEDDGYSILFFNNGKGVASVDFPDTIYESI